MADWRQAAAGARPGLLARPPGRLVPSRWGLFHDHDRFTVAICGISVVIMVWLLGKPAGRPRTGLPATNRRLLLPCQFGILGN